MLCSSIAGVSSSGVVSCVGVSGASPSVGGAASAVLTIRTGGVDSPLPVELMPCETYGADFFAPAIAAFVLCAVTIVAARMSYERIFGTPSTP